MHPLCVVRSETFIVFIVMMPSFSKKENCICRRCIYTYRRGMYTEKIQRIKKWRSRNDDSAPPACMKEM
jgi:hypothetical protein